uniref:Uncharacterized protein n=1 Tax=Panagrolaimus davidi TaxID=227884 RepID=A0A914PEL8_9BILA
MPSNMEIVNFCCEGSVLSQCKNIVRDKNRRWKLFWFAVFIVTLAAGLWYGSTAIQDYLSYPSHARFYMAEIQDLPFPAVTVCNLNPMDKNKNVFDKNIKELMILYRYYASQLSNNTSTPPKKDPMNSRFKREIAGIVYNVNLNDTVCVTTTTTAAVTTTEEPTSVLTSTPEVTTTATSTTTAIETTKPPSVTTTVSTAESTIAFSSLAADVSTKISQPPTSEALEPTKITQPKTSDASVISSLTISQTADASAATTTNAQSTTTTDTPTSDASTTAKQAQSSTSDATATTSAFQPTTTDSSETTKRTESPASDASATTMLPTTDVAKQTKTLPQSGATEAETTLIITKSSTADKPRFETTTLTQSPTTEDSTQTTKHRETSTTETFAVGTTTQSSKSHTTDESQSTTNLDHSPSDSSSSDSSSKTTKELTQSPTTDTSDSKTLKIKITKPTTLPHEKTESPITDTAITAKATSAAPTEEETTGSTFTKTTAASLSTSTAAKVLSSSTHSAKSAASTSTSETAPSETTLPHPSSTVESPTTEQHTTALPSELLSEIVSSSTTTFKSITSTHSSSALKLESSTTVNQMQTQKYTTTPSTKMTIESLSKTAPSSINSVENIFTSNQITTSTTLSSEMQTTTVHNSIVSTTSNDDNKNDATTLEQNIQVSSMSTTTAIQMQTQKYTTIPYTIDRGDGKTTTSSTSATATSTSTETSHVSTVATSSAVGSANEKPNENAGSSLPTSSTSSLNPQPSDDETVSSSSRKLPTTLSDSTRPTTFISKLISSTPSSIESTTPEPIVFEIYTQKQINELETKYKINSTSTSRISLESKIQDRLVAMMRIDQNGGYGIKDIIIQCTFDKEECDMDNDFVHVYDPWYGNCYTFNYDGKYGITRAGTDYGLKMLVFSNISEYMETSSRSGFKIVLHRQNYAPFPNSDGLYVKTGKRSTINVKYRSFDALPAPYGICQPDKNTTGYIYDGYYTAEGCLRSCYQHKIIENCSCADPRYPKPKGSNVSWCDGTNLKSFLCYANYLETQGDFVKVSNCYCPPGCHKHTFNHNIATSNWPIKRKPFVTPMCNGYWPKTNIKCYDAYEKNAAMIGISHFNLLYRKTLQEADYWWWDVFEMFMGNLGLFTGITCLAAFEFLEFFILLLWRPNWISEEEEETDENETDDNEMTEMPRKKDNKIYDSNMTEENSVDIPLPFIGLTSAIGLDPSMESEDANHYSATKTSLDIMDELESAEPNQPKSSSGVQFMQGSSLVDNQLEKYLNSLLFKPQICPFNWRKYHPELPMEMGYNSPYSNNPGSANDTIPMKFDEEHEADVFVSHNDDIRRRSSIKPKDTSTKSHDSK